MLVHNIVKIRTKKMDKTQNVNRDWYCGDVFVVIENLKEIQIDNEQVELRVHGAQGVRMSTLSSLRRFGFLTVPACDFSSRLENTGQLQSVQ